jgi:hypothetical protein
MFEHPILNAIRREGFMPLGWFAPRPEDEVPPADEDQPAQFVVLIGNAGPEMFQRFRSTCRAAEDSLDEWCREVIGKMAVEVCAKAVFPFDKPPAPFLRWARRGGATHQSPLGFNIHADFGLWHAYRAALIFGAEFDIPPIKSISPCETCQSKPCLSACPVNAFDGTSYEVNSCVDHIVSPKGTDCMSGGCLARRACPVGRAYAYVPAQMQFHMIAFRNSRLAARQQTG